MKTFFFNGIFKNLLKITTHLKMLVNIGILERILVFTFIINH